MPSDKKRINLTIPDEIYERLQAYKNETGIVNDATACLQLIVQQLNAHANNKAVLHFLQNSTLEQLQQAANEGAAQFQELREKGITWFMQKSTRETGVPARKCESAAARIPSDRVAGFADKQRFTMSSKAIAYRCTTSKRERSIAFYNRVP